MNIWKPAALASTSALVLLVGYQAALANPAPVAPSVEGNQPNMEAALSHLKQARDSLEKAEHNKGGWRAAAVTATDNAIKETARGLAFADTH